MATSPIFSTLYGSNVITLLIVLPALLATGLVSVDAARRGVSVAGPGTPVSSGQALLSGFAISPQLSARSVLASYGLTHLKRAGEPR